MKPIITIITCLLALGCRPSEQAKSDSAGVVETPSSGAEQPRAHAAERSIELSHDQTTLEIAVGTQLRYSYKSHASVGHGATFEIGDPAVLNHVRTDLDYVQSAEEREGKDGADRATGILVFEAIAPGTTRLQVRETFRGDTERETTYAIEVVQ